MTTTKLSHAQTDLWLKTFLPDHVKLHMPAKRRGRLDAAKTSTASRRNDVKIVPCDPGARFSHTRARLLNKLKTIYEEKKQQN